MDQLVKATTLFWDCSSIALHKVCSPHLKCLLLRCNAMSVSCRRAEIQKKYKRLALKYHPDKAGGSQDAHEHFQAITTAYHVLSNKHATKAYWDMYRLRCYMYQVAHMKGQPLMPFYIMVAKKRNDRGMWQRRLLTLNLGEGCLQNWKKDKPHRTIPLTAIKSVSASDKSSFTISFSNGHREYRLQTDHQEQSVAYMSVLQAIVDGVQAETADGIFPPRCERKGYVEKRGKTGDWTRRWLMLGSSHLLIFRNQSCEELVNAVPLHADFISTDLMDKDGAWRVITHGRTWVFRNSKLVIAKDWVAALKKMVQQSSVNLPNWLSVRTEPSISSAMVYSMKDVDSLLASVTTPDRPSALLVDTPLECGLPAAPMDDSDRPNGDTVMAKYEGEADDDDEPAVVRKVALSVDPGRKGVLNKIGDQIGEFARNLSYSSGVSAEANSVNRGTSIPAKGGKSREMAVEDNSRAVAEHLANRMVREHV